MRSPRLGTKAGVGQAGGYNLQGPWPIHGGGRVTTCHTLEGRVRMFGQFDPEQRHLTGEIPLETKFVYLVGKPKIWEHRNTGTRKQGTRGEILRGKNVVRIWTAAEKCGEEIGSYLLSSRWETIRRILEK